MKRTVGDSFLATEDVLSLLKISRTTLYRWERDGKFPKANKITKSCKRWRASVVQLFMEGNWKKD